MPTTPIGHMIQSGEAIPDDVTRMQGHDALGRPVDLVLTVEAGNGDVSFWASYGRCEGQWSDDEIPRFLYPLEVLRVRETAAPKAEPAKPAAPPLMLDIPARVPGARRVRVHRANPAETSEYLSDDGARWRPASRAPWEESGSLSWRGLFAVGAVEVVEREPRTFPKLDDAPDNLNMVGIIRSSGNRAVYRRSTTGRDEWRRINANGVGVNVPVTWQHLRSRGDLVEIFDPAAFLTTDTDD